MACEWKRLPDGTMIVICGGRRQSCSAPGCTKWASKLCDFPVNTPRKKSRTCDAPICAQHAAKAGDDIDWCPPHARYVKEQEDRDA